METERDKEKKFESWIAGMSNRIDEWIECVPPSDLSFNFSIESLDNLERFLIDNYAVEDLENEANRMALDGAVSYIGETIINVLRESRWVIYLDDESNIYFGLPCVLTKYSGAVAVHLLLKEILEAKTGKVLTSRLNKIISYENLIVAQLNAH